MKFNDFITALQRLHPFNLWQGDRHIFDAPLKGITTSTTEVKKDFIFAALKGARVNGEKFIPEAIQRGATIIVTSHQGYQLYSDQFPTVTFIETDNPKLCLSKIATIFYPKMPAVIVAVTGTNGKSSTVEFVRQIWEHLNYRAASIGTLGTVSKHFNAPKHLTTPDPVFLHRTMEDLVGHKISHVAIEASSHGLDQYRLDGLTLSAGGFTSFGHDHLDYHKTLDAYFEAKSTLFSRLLRTHVGVAVLNADIPEYTALKKAAHGLPSLSYGRKGTDLKIERLHPLTTGQQIDLNLLGKTYTLTLPLIGEFQVYNALCALGLVLSDIDVPVDKAVAALETLTPPPGRLELAGTTPTGAPVYVDYAHAASALETVLKTLRTHTKRHLWVVFGAGGERDPSTRKPMGVVAQQHADHVIITDDNPRTEIPEFIRASIKEGAPKALEIADRREAIQYALHQAQKGDMILVARKGPEDGQIYANRIEPFLDSRVIKELLGQKVPHEK